MRTSINMLTVTTEHRRLMSKSETVSNTMSVEAAFSGAQDSTFRARATTEYRRVQSWVGSSVNLDKATILDFGCGEGVPAVSFALRHPEARIIGLDIQEVSIERLERSLWNQSKLKIPNNVEFRITEDGSIPGDDMFDLIYSWSVLNHIDIAEFNNLADNLHQKLRPGGALFVQVEPLFYSHSGSLLYRYFKDPWHHLTLSLSTMRDRIIFEGAGEREMREWQQFLELNRMTAEEMVARIQRSGFEKTREEIQRATEVPPDDLMAIYNPNVLTARGFQAMFRKINSA